MEIKLGKGVITIYDDESIGQAMTTELSRRDVAYGFVSVEENLGHRTIDLITKLNHATEHFLKKTEKTLDKDEEKFFKDLENLISNYYTKN